jgi:hypothetical protein
MTEETDQPQEEGIDFTHDSVRLLSNGERVKCMTIVDITQLSEGRRKKFLNRALFALTKMGKKVMEEKE